MMIQSPDKYTDKVLLSHAAYGYYKKEEKVESKARIESEDLLSYKRKQVKKTVSIL